MSFVFDVFLPPLQRHTHEKMDHRLFSALLATSIPSVIDNGYCTKENCTNDTLAGHVRQAATILPEEATEEEVERSCDTLFMCIVTTLNKGLRNGGGIGDVLRQPSSQVKIVFEETFIYFFFSL